MTGNRRTIAYVVIALIVGAALAVAVALAGGEKGGAAATIAEDGAPAAAGVYSDDAGAAELAAADPAKEQPLLDRFTSKDPFIPFPTPGSTVAPTGTPVPEPTSTAAPTNLSAKVKVDGTNYSVMQGDKVPGGSAAEFSVTGVSSGDVTFRVIDGTLEGGDKSFSVKLGEAVRITLDSGVSYDISVISIGSAGGGGDATSHTITVLNITSQDGVPVATFEVDGKTYTDKRQGDVFSTTWGEIEVLAIDVDAQTVTILHGDQTLVLHAGQVIVK